MVTNKNITELDFKTIEEYFDYIADSVVNGQKEQAKRLIKQLSLPQRRDCLNFFEFSIETGELLNTLREMLGAKFYGSAYLIPLTNSETKNRLKLLREFTNP